jgi:hypothetical protein
MDCPPYIYRCIDVLYQEKINISQTLQMPVCLGDWRSVPLIKGELPSGGFATVYVVEPIGDDVIATIVHGGHVIATVRAPQKAAWECLSTYHQVSSP